MNSHGTKKAYEIDKCRCTECVTAQRERWARKDARRDRAGGGETSAAAAVEVDRQRGELETFQQVSGFHAELAEVIRLPLSDQDGSEGAGQEIPRLWPTSAQEPPYAAEHRELLAVVIAGVIADPANYWASPTITEDSSKAEAKDFARLIKAFRKFNPGLINVDQDNYRGFTPYRFLIYSPDFVVPDDSETSGAESCAEPETVAEPEPEPEPEPLAQIYVPTPALVSSIPRKNAAWYRVAPNTKGFCSVFEGDQSCNVTAGGRSDAVYLVRDSKSVMHPACFAHFTKIQRTHPDRVQSRRARGHLGLR